jgi:hypothetical protein
MLSDQPGSVANCSLHGSDPCTFSLVIEQTFDFDSMGFAVFLQELHMSSDWGGTRMVSATQEQCTRMVTTMQDQCMMCR